jgi:hypothetical protein
MDPPGSKEGDTTVTQFDRPDAGGGDQFVNEQHVGDLLVLQVHDAVRGLQTENGLADVIRADVHVIGPENGGVIRETFTDTYVFGKVLFSQLRQKAGRTVVGILEGQPGVKVQGKNVPYRLNGEIPPQAEQAAVRAMQSRPDPHPQQQPAGSSWGTPPAGQQGGPSPWEQQQAPAPQQPGGWGQPQPAATPPAPQPGPWGQQPLPAAPPAQQPQQPAQTPGPWGAPPPAPWEQPAAAPGGAPPY